MSVAAVRRYNSSPGSTSRPNSVGSGTPIKPSSPPVNERHTTDIWNKTWQMQSVRMAKAIPERRVTTRPVRNATAAAATMATMVERKKSADMFMANMPAA